MQYLNFVSKKIFFPAVSRCDVIIVDEIAFLIFQEWNQFFIRCYSQILLEFELNWL